MAHRLCHHRSVVTSRPRRRPVHLVADPQHRQTRIALARDQFLKSIGTYPTPAAHHHLALALALPGPSRNLEDAISFARAAVESAAHEIRHWHLLGLLLTAEEQWEKAQSIMEIAANIGVDPGPTESRDETTIQNGETTTTTTTLNGIKVRDFELERTPVRSSATSPDLTPLLDHDARSIPPSDTLLQPLPDHPVPSSRDSFEYALQLRLTQMALTEHVEGPEGAEAKWVAVYGWIAERKASVADTSRESLSLSLSRLSYAGIHLTVRTTERSSMDTSSKSAGTHLTSSVLVEMPQESQVEKGRGQGRSGPLGLSIVTTDVGPPITITPATPADGEFRTSLNGVKVKRSGSMERDHSAGKKMQQMLKDRVHKGQEKISTISKKIGHGVVRSGGLHIRRASSAPGERI